MPIVAPDRALIGGYVPPLIGPNPVPLDTSVLPETSGAVSIWAEMFDEWINITSMVSSMEVHMGFTSPTVSGWAPPAGGSLILVDAEGRFSRFNPHRRIDPHAGPAVEIYLGGNRNGVLLFKGHSRGVKRKEAGNPPTFNPVMSIVGVLGWVEEFGDGYWHKLGDPNEVTNEEWTPSAVIRTILKEMEQWGSIPLVDNARLSENSQIRLWPNEVNLTAASSRGLSRSRPLQGLSEIVLAEMGKGWDGPDGDVNYETYIDRRRADFSEAYEIVNAVSVEEEDDLAYIVNKVTSDGAADYRAAGQDLDIEFWHYNTARGARAFPLLIPIPPGGETSHALMHIKWDGVLTGPFNILGWVPDLSLANPQAQAFVQSWDNLHVEYPYEVKRYYRHNGVILDFPNPTNRTITAIVNPDGSNPKGTVFQRVNNPYNFAFQREASIRAYGPRSFDLPSRMIRDREDRETLSRLWAADWDGIGRLGEKVPAQGLKVVLKDIKRRFNVSDRVRLYYDSPFKTHTDGHPFFVEGVRYSWNKENDDRVDAQLYLLDAWRHPIPHLRPDGSFTLARPRETVAGILFEQPRLPIHSLVLPNIERKTIQALNLPDTTALRQTIKEMALVGENPLPPAGQRQPIQSIFFPTRNVIHSLRVEPPPPPPRREIHTLDLTVGGDTGPRSTIQSIELEAPPGGDTGAIEVGAYIVSAYNIEATVFWVLAAPNPASGGATSDLFVRAAALGSTNWTHLITILASSSPTPVTRRQAHHSLSPSTIYVVQASPFRDFSGQVKQILVTTGRVTVTEEGALSLAVNGRSRRRGYAVQLTARLSGTLAGQVYFRRYRKTSETAYTYLSTVGAVDPYNFTVENLEPATPYVFEISLDLATWVTASTTTLGDATLGTLWTAGALATGPETATITIRVNRDTTAWFRYKDRTTQNWITPWSGRALATGTTHIINLEGLTPDTSYESQLASDATFTNDILTPFWVTPVSGTQATVPWRLAPNQVTQTSFAITVTGGHSTQTLYLSWREKDTTNAWNTLASGVTVNQTIGNTYTARTTTRAPISGGKSYEVRASVSDEYLDGETWTVTVETPTTPPPPEEEDTPPITLGRPYLWGAVGAGEVNDHNTLQWRTDITNPATGQVHSRYRKLDQVAYSSPPESPLTIGGGSDNATFRADDLDPATTYRVEVALNATFTSQFQFEEFTTQGEPQETDPFINGIYLILRSHDTINFNVGVSRPSSEFTLYVRHREGSGAWVEQDSGNGRPASANVTSYSLTGLTPSVRATDTTPAVINTVTIEASLNADYSGAISQSWDTQFAPAPTDPDQPEPPPMVETPLSIQSIVAPIVTETAAGITIRLNNGPQNDGKTIYWGYRLLTGTVEVYTQSGSYVLAGGRSSYSTTVSGLTADTAYVLAASTASNFPDGQTATLQIRTARIPPPLSLFGFLVIARGTTTLRWRVFVRNPEAARNQRVYARLREVGTTAWIDSGQVAIRTSGLTSAVFAATDLDAFTNYEIQVATDALFTENVMSVQAQTLALPPSVVRVTNITATTSTLTFRITATNWQMKRLTTQWRIMGGIWTRGLNEVASAARVDAVPSRLPERTYEFEATVAGGGASNTASDTAFIPPQLPSIRTFDVPRTFATDVRVQMSLTRTAPGTIRVRLSVFGIGASWSEEAGENISAFHLRRAGIDAAGANIYTSLTVLRSSFSGLGTAFISRTLGNLDPGSWYVFTYTFPDGDDARSVSVATQA